MKNKTSIAVLLVAVTLTVVSTAAAQTPKRSSGFVDVNIGAQPQSRTIATSTSFPLYGETAIINAAEAIDGSPLFDFGGGYLFGKQFGAGQLGAGVAFSFAGKKGDGTLAASVPNPNIFNRPATVSVSGSDLKHREFATHIMAVWTKTLTDEMDIAISGGPSFFRLTQDVMSATVASGTQNVSVATTQQKDSATGGNIGVNLNYMFNPKYGVGILLRYAGTSVDLPAAADVKVGGFQFGIGARLRF
jgi:hypothetical protein